MLTADPIAPVAPRAPSNGTHAQIRDFITQRFPRPDLGDHEDIFALGYVNSLFAMQLILFVEKTFGVAVETEDLEIDNFRSVAAIGRLVERRRGGSAPVQASYDPKVYEVYEGAD